MKREKERDSSAISIGVAVLLSAVPRSLELSRSPQVANFVFEFGKPPDRLGLYTQIIERREIDLPVAPWFQGGAEQWPMPRLQ